MCPSSSFDSAILQTRRTLFGETISAVSKHLSAVSKSRIFISDFPSVLS
ncbi:MAG: DUF3648 domain-containing protein, partial [Proteobacteria bacterium]